jgi:transcriptional regulator with XRE-family HTH domain
MNYKTTPYGALLRERRVRAGLSLRDVAGHLDASHVFIADVERGMRGPLRPDHESKLLQVLPNLTREELTAARHASQSFKLTSTNTPPRYADVTHALARRIEQNDLSDTKINRILRILRSEDEE